MVHMWDLKNLQLDSTFSDYNVPWLPDYRLNGANIDRDARKKLIALWKDLKGDEYTEPPNATFRDCLGGSMDMAEGKMRDLATFPWNYNREQARICV